MLSGMDNNSQSDTLTWESSYSIALRLADQYPDLDLDTVGLQMIYDWVVELPEFDDDPALYNEHILADILREWYEETSKL